MNEAPPYHYVIMDIIILPHVNVLNPIFVSHEIFNIYS